MVRAPWGYGLHLVLGCERNTVETVIREGDNPVREAEQDEQDPEYCQTRGTWQEGGGTTPQG